MFVNVFFFPKEKEKRKIRLNQAGLNWANGFNWNGITAQNKWVYADLYVEIFFFAYVVSEHDANVFFFFIFFFEWIKVIKASVDIFLCACVFVRAWKIHSTSLWCWSIQQLIGSMRLQTITTMYKQTGKKTGFPFVGEKQRVKKKIKFNPLEHDTSWHWIQADINRPEIFQKRLQFSRLDATSSSSSPSSFSSFPLFTSIQFLYRGTRASYGIHTATIKCDVMRYIVLRQRKKKSGWWWWWLKYKNVSERNSKYFASSCFFSLSETIENINKIAISLKRNHTTKNLWTRVCSVLICVIEFGDFS